MAFFAPLTEASAPKEIDAFVQSYLSASDTGKKFMWLTGDKKTTSAKIMGHPYYKIRVPYWQAKSQAQSKSAKTLWVLEEIGKEKLITIGIVIENGNIQAVRIIKFRESRGWEIELPSFTNQFTQVGFEENTDNYQLNKHINGISGATLSVRAVKKVSRLALYLQQQLPNP